VKRAALLLVLAAIALGAAYRFAIYDETVAPTVRLTTPAAAIGTGSDAVAVSGEGKVLAWLPPPEDESLPLLPLAEPPERGRLRGTALQQARVLGAAPARLRPYLERSFYGESGVDVELRSGIELRFGDASGAAAKWRAAAAVFADPTVTSLDYVDLLAPRRPSIGGSGHTLPAVP